MIMSTHRHKYQYIPDSHTAAAKAVAMVGVNKRVLELGPGPGAVTKLLKENDCAITALELDSQAIQVVSEYCEKVFACDLNNPEWPDLLLGTDKFDVIVATDVLEHLYDPWETLKKLHGLMSTEGYLVISVPHIGHNAVVACLLRGDFEYQPRNLLDKTHIRFFAIKNVQKLFNDADFKIIEASFVIKTPEQTEFARHWRSLSSETRATLNASNPYGAIYQIVIKAVPMCAQGEGLKLMSMDIPVPGNGGYSVGARGSRVLGFILSYINLRTRDKIVAFIEKLGLKL